MRGAYWTYYCFLCYTCCCPLPPLPVPAPSAAPASLCLVRGAPAGAVRIAAARTAPLPCPARYVEVTDICGYDLGALGQQAQGQGDAEFLAVMINSGWQLGPGEIVGQRLLPAGAPGALDPATAPPQLPSYTGRRGDQGDPLTHRLYQLPLGRICPCGFVFIWAEKGEILPVRGKSGWLAQKGTVP